MYKHAVQRRVIISNSNRRTSDSVHVLQHTGLPDTRKNVSGKCRWQRSTIRAAEHNKGTQSTMKAETWKTVVVPNLSKMYTMSCSALIEA